MIKEGRQGFVEVFGETRLYVGFSHLLAFLRHSSRNCLDVCVGGGGGENLTVFTVLLTINGWVVRVQLRVYQYMCCAQTHYLAYTAQCVNVCIWLDKSIHTIAVGHCVHLSSCRVVQGGQYSRHQGNPLLCGMHILSHRPLVQLTLFMK